MNISLAAEPIFKLGSFSVTNSLLMSWVVLLFLMVLALKIKIGLKVIPRGLQNMVEYVFELFLGLIDGVTQNRQQSRKFFPLVVTIFLFVILVNWLGIVPGLGTVGIYEEHQGQRVLIPFIRAASADLNFTLALAIISVLTVQISGIAAIGFFKYVGKFFISPFKKPYFVGTFVGVLESISEAAKLISFSFRLFGNIFAGEVLLTVTLFLVPYLIPLPFLALEIFVGFVQALVFSILTLVFMKMATMAHEIH
jgi:F-type H+-transporting ATPase subunit a